MIKFVERYRYIVVNIPQWKNCMGEPQSSKKYYLRHDKVIYFPTEITWTSIEIIACKKYVHMKL